MSRLGADERRLSTDVPTRKGEQNTFYKDTDRYIDAPAEVIRWCKKGEGYAITYDRYTVLLDNLRLIHLYIKETENTGQASENRLRRVRDRPDSDR